MMNFIPTYDTVSDNANIFYFENRLNVCPRYTRIRDGNKMVISIMLKSVAVCILYSVFMLFCPVSVINTNHNIYQYSIILSNLI